MSKQDRYRTAKNATILNAIVNALLSLLKIIAGFLFHSHALFADGIHSLADLFTDSLVLIGAKYSSQDADDKHPYGHQRIETAFTLFLSLILILAGIGIAWDAFEEIIKKAHDIPQIYALPVAMISIVMNELLFQYTHYIGKKIHSNLIMTNAWHRRSDAASSLVVLVGIMGSYLSYPGLDAIAAIIVSILIIKMGCEYTWNSMKELVDTAVEPQLLSEIDTTITKVEGVVKIHQLRSRSMAGDIFIDLHIQVEPWITVSEGHYIAQKVHHTLLHAFKQIKDVTIHVDPEDDETANPAFHLPSRLTLENTLLKPWQEQYADIQYWIIHYLDGAITLDLYVKKPFEEAQLQQMQARLNPDHHIKKIRCFTIQSLDMN